MSYNGDEGDPVDKTNLIVNYLPQELRDEEFVSLFEQIGHVKTGRIIRNKHTNYSYGFGFIQYWKKEDALKAIERLNGYQLKHKRLKVAFSRPQNSNIKQAKLYVKNLPINCNEEQLAQIFSKYGKIIQLRVLDGEARKKGIAFVLYDLHEQAEKAIEHLNGVQLNGSLFPLEIKFANENNKERVYSNQSNSHTGDNNRSNQNYRDMYRDVGISDSLNYSSYHFDNNLMSGPIRNIPYNKQYYRYNPFNNQFLRMAENGESSRSNFLQASNSMSAYGNHSSNSNNSTTEVSRNDGQGSEYILFVYNIGSQTDEKTLAALFSKFGHVIKSQVIRKGSESRGFAFVTMSCYEDAMNAIQSLNGFVFRGKCLQVNFKQ